MHSSLCGTIDFGVAVTEYRVSCIEKTARLTPWEQVTHLLLRKAEGGLTKKIAYYDAIQAAKDGTGRFLSHTGVNKLNWNLPAMHWATKTCGQRSTAKEQMFCGAFVIIETRNENGLGIEVAGL